MNSIQLIKERVINYINNGQIQKVLERNFIKNNEHEFINVVNEYCKLYNIDRWIEKLYLYLNNKVPGKCSCDKYTSFIDYNRGYRVYCSSKCSNNADDVKIKQVNSINEKYGVDSVLQLDSVRKLIDNTDVNKIAKARETFIKNKDINIIKQKEKEYRNFVKTGYEHSILNPVTIEKRNNTMLLNYGVIVPILNNDIRKQIESTNLKKYGVEFGLSSNIVRDKINDTIHSKKLDIIHKYLGLLKFIDYNRDTNMISYSCDKCSCTSDISFQSLYLRHKNNIEICIVCNPYIKTYSVDEKEILKFISDNYDGDIIENSKDIISPYELDIYLPKSGIAFEFNGIYWHSEYFKDKNYHLMKKNLCLNKNIDLIHIWEDDWLYKKDIIKSIILNKLGKCVKIYARKCVIKEISNSLCKEFLNDNHLQGFLNASINIGLYYNDELVSLMTFSNRKLYKNDDIELLRFCNKKNTTIIGGASKLFNYFKNTYNFDEIISYSNNDFGNGNLYKQLGFTFIKETVPNYWWIINNIREYRLRYNKQKLIKSDLLIDGETELECMHRLGHYRLFDCGSKLWRFKN